VVAAIQWLVAGLSGGHVALFYSLVLLHALAALVGFISIGFAGSYAGRAYLPSNDPVAGEGPRPPGEVMPAAAGPPRAELGRAGPDDPAPDAGSSPVSEGGGPAAASGDQDLRDGPGTARPTGTDVLQPDLETEELLRYFEKPARLWWAILAVPFLGLGALASNSQLGGIDQAWVLGALLVWLAATLVAASLVVPALREMRSMLHPGQPRGQLAGRGPERIRFARVAALASRGAACCDVLFFVALALMIWRP